MNQNYDWAGFFQDNPRQEGWDWAAEWEARLEVLEQLRVRFVRLQSLRRAANVALQAKIWDLADQLRRIAEDLEEDPVEAGWIWEGWGDWLTWDVAWAYSWQDLQ